MFKEPFGAPVPPKNKISAEIDDVLKKEGTKTESPAYLVTFPDGTTAMAEDKEQEIELRRQWNENRG